MNISVITGSSCLLLLNGAAGSSGSTSTGSSTNNSRSSTGNGVSGTGFEVPSTFKLGGMALSLNLPKEHDNRTKLMEHENLMLSLEMFLFQAEQKSTGAYFDTNNRPVIQNGKILRRCYDIDGIPILRCDPYNESQTHYYEYLVRGCVFQETVKALSDEDVEKFLNNIQVAKECRDKVPKQCQRCIEADKKAKREFRHKQKVRRLERERTLMEQHAQLIKRLTEAFDRHDRTKVDNFKALDSKCGRGRANTIDVAKIRKLHSDAEVKSTIIETGRKRADSLQ